MTITQPRQIDAILVDLDQCLYDNPEMDHHVAENIRGYMAEELGLPPDEVAERCAEYYLHYGTTLAGLVAHGCHVDYQRWHDRVHASLPYERYLKPDPALRDMLDSIPLPKVVFTNADRAHAARCLGLLGITGCFRRVVAFEDVMEAAAEQGLVRHGCPVVCKPNRQAFDVALALAGGMQPSTTLWLDDSARNITTGHRMGMFSVLVGRTGVACPSDHQIRRIHDLPTALPWLWHGRQPPCLPAPAPVPAIDDAQAVLRAEDGAAAKKAAAAAADVGAGGEQAVEAVH